MAALIKPGTVKILTKDGEVQVSLTVDININLNTDGLNFESKNKTNNYSVNNEKEIEVQEKVDWMIPDFESTKIDFGKKA